MEKLINVLDRTIRAAIALLFGAVAVCVLIQIIARYTPPSISAPWTDEMTRLFFLYTVMLSAPWAILYHQYASIDIIAHSFKGKLKVASDILVDVIIVIVAAIGIPQASMYYKVGTVSKSTSLQLNLGLFYVVPMVIFILTVLCCIVDITRQIKKFKEEA